MESNYRILESARETTVYMGDEHIATFFGTEGKSYALAQRFVAREEYLDLIAEALCEYEPRVNDDE